MTVANPAPGVTVEALFDVLVPDGYARLATRDDVHDGWFWRIGSAWIEQGFEKAVAGPHR